MKEDPGHLELVVAHYDEDLAWLRNVPAAVRVLVYSKGDAPAGAFPLPNVGREAHTYLHHIVSRYDRLADTTVFCQGRPFDHVPSFHRTLRRLAEQGGLEAPFRWYGFVVDEDDRTGSLFRSWSKNEDGRGLDLYGFWRFLFQTEPPEAFPFFLGAHFAVTAGQVRTRPVRFYERALDMAARYADGPHCLERLWDEVFMVNGIPEDLEELPKPVYLRPIEKRGITWDDVPPGRRGW